MLCKVMVWTEEDEHEFQEYVQGRNERGVAPFNPLGPGHEPPSEADLTAMLPITTRLEWAKPITPDPVSTSQQQAQPPGLGLAADERRSKSRPELPPNPLCPGSGPDA